MVPILSKLIVSASPIPRIYHFVFGLRRQTEPFHLAFYLALESCRQINRPERILLHYFHEPWGPLWERIKPHLELHRVSTFPEWLAQHDYQDKIVKRYRHAHLADFVRLEVLQKHGGIYADIDTLFLRPLPSDLHQHDFVIGREANLVDRNTRESQPSLCNALLMAKPDSAFLRRWIELLPTEFDGSWSNHSCQLPARLARENPTELAIEPSYSFYPYMWNSTDLSELLEQDAPTKADRAYSIHLWNHLWWEPRRGDFCAFNEHLLDREYITAGLTTYAQLARPFLPPPGIDNPGKFSLQYFLGKIKAMGRA